MSEDDTELSSCSGSPFYELLRDEAVVAVLDVLLTNDGMIIGVDDLVERAGVTRGRVEEIVGELVELGVVEETDVQTTDAYRWNSDGEVGEALADAHTTLHRETTAIESADGLAGDEADETMYLVVVDGSVGNCRVDGPFLDGDVAETHRRGLIAEGKAHPETASADVVECEPRVETDLDPTFEYRARVVYDDAVDVYVSDWLDDYSAAVEKAQQAADERPFLAHANIQRRNPNGDIASVDGYGRQPFSTEGAWENDWEWSATRDDERLLSERPEPTNGG